MRVRCRLREIRENLPRKPDGKRLALSDLAERSGVSAGVLSQIERGVMLPPDRQLAALEEAYGAPIQEWYSPRALVVLEADPEDE